MIDKPFKSETAMLDNNAQIVYNLIFQNALYSLECYIRGSNRNNVRNKTFIENITDDEGEAEVFLHRLAKGKVFPVHIKDMVEDYFVSH